MKIITANTTTRHELGKVDTQKDLFYNCIGAKVFIGESIHNHERYVCTNNNLFGQWIKLGDPITISTPTTEIEYKHDNTYYVVRHTESIDELDITDNYFYDDESFTYIDKNVPMIVFRYLNTETGDKFTKVGSISYVRSYLDDGTIITYNRFGEIETIKMLKINEGDIKEYEIQEYGDFEDRDYLTTIERYQNDRLISKISEGANSINVVTDYQYNDKGLLVHEENKANGVIVSNTDLYYDSDDRLVEEKIELFNRSSDSNTSYSYSRIHEYESKANANGPFSSVFSVFDVETVKIGEDVSCINSVIKQKSGENLTKMTESDNMRWVYYYNNDELIYTETNLTNNDGISLNENRSYMYNIYDDGKLIETISFTQLFEI